MDCTTTPTSTPTPKPTFTSTSASTSTSISARTTTLDPPPSHAISSAPSLAPEPSTITTTISSASSSTSFANPIPTPTAPCPSAPNAHVSFHLNHTGLETTPRAFPVCISPGRGVIVRQGFLTGIYGWTCLRPGGEVERFAAGGGITRSTSITFPGNVGGARAVPEHTVRILGRAEVEFSVLRGEVVEVEVPISRGEVVEVSNSCGGGVRDRDRDTSANTDVHTDTDTDIVRVRVRVKVEALVVAANEEFCPTGGTEGVGIWIGADEARVMGFRVREKVRN